MSHQGLAVPYQDKLQTAHIGRLKRRIRRRYQRSAVGLACVTSRGRGLVFFFFGGIGTENRGLGTALLIATLRHTPNCIVITTSPWCREWRRGSRLAGWVGLLVVLNGVVRTCIWDQSCYYVQPRAAWKCPATDPWGD